MATLVLVIPDDFDPIAFQQRAALALYANAVGEICDLQSAICIQADAITPDVIAAIKADADRITTLIHQPTNLPLPSPHLELDVAAVFAAYAERLGKSVDDLTERERQQAWLDAVLAHMAPPATHDPPP